MTKYEAKNLVMSFGFKEHSFCVIEGIGVMTGVLVIMFYDWSFRLWLYKNKIKKAMKERCHVSVNLIFCKMI